MSSSDLFGDAAPPPAPVMSPQSRYDLRPLSTGEVLDRTFQVYRSHFSLFVGLMVFPAAINVVISALRLLYTAHQDRHVHVGAALYRAQFTSGSLALLSVLISFVIYGITEAASTWAVSAVYLGEPTSIRDAYAVSLRHWFRYTLIKLRQVWAFLWLPILLLILGLASLVAVRLNASFVWLSVAIFILAGLGFIYGIWAYIRISLSIPASVIESLPTRPSLKRSAQLLVTRKFRILLLFLLIIALYMVVLTIQSPILILTMRSRGAHLIVSQILALGIGFVSGTLLAPIMQIGLCIFYFDERVRREGFDIEWMMKKLAPASNPPTATAPPLPAQSNPGEIS